MNFCIKFPLLCSRWNIKGNFNQNSFAQIENDFQYGLIYIKAELVLPLKGANFFPVKLELMTSVLTPGPLLVWSALLTTNSNSILNFKGHTSAHCVLLEHYYSVDFPWWFDRNFCRYCCVRRFWKQLKKFLKTEH